MNSPQARDLVRRLNLAAITVLNNKDHVLPLHTDKDQKIALLEVGDPGETEALAKQMTRYASLVRFRLRPKQTEEENRRLYDSLAGGSPVASELIRRELELVKKAGKPVVASFGDYAASGGYWVALGADTIVTDPMSITGSIGVFGMMPTFEKAIDRLSLGTGGVSTSPLADAMNPLKSVTPEYGKMMELSVARIYRDFISLVAKGRKMDEQKVAAVDRKDATVEDTHIETENTTGSKIVINTDILNVRKDATEDSEALGIAEQGDEFDIIAEDGEWIEIDYNGNNGYVKQEYVQFK